MQGTVVFTVIGLFLSLLSVAIALSAFKRNERQDQKAEGKQDGLILSDVGYIKACVDRMEKNLTSMDERYRNIVERLAKVEERLNQQSNLNKKSNN